MAFRTLGEVLQTLSAQGMIDGLGEDRIAVRSLRPKRAASNVPAAKSFREETLRAKEVDASRWEYTATKAGAPHSEAVYCHLRVIEGSRRAGGGGRSPALRRSPRERARELNLRVVHSAASR